MFLIYVSVFFFQAEDGIRDGHVTGVQTCALPIFERNETGGRNLPPTANYAYPRSHASGLAQEQPQTWRDWTKHTGIGAEAAEAYQATPDEQRANENYALKTYGPNDSYTWAASAPRGGYKDSTTEKDPFADIPVAKGKAQGSDPFADIPAAKPWRVPPTNEGPRANIRGVPQGMPAPQQHMGPPQRPTGPMDPSITAQTKIPTAQPGFFDPEKKVYAMLISDPAGTLKKIG